MLEFNTKTVREIALEAPQTTRIFEQFKIDYCCGGRMPLAEACQAVGADFALVSQKLESLFSADDENKDYPERKAPSDLIDYIIGKHHVYTTAEIARLTPLMEKVSRKHGDHHRELLNLHVVFNALAEDLTLHMRKEEMVLFPFIKRMEESLRAGLSVELPHFRTVQNPVRMMLAEHDAAGDFLRQMRELTDDYSVSPEACPSFKALYSGLEDLEKDLHRHIHLENNVLFPQAIEMEVKIFGDESAAKSAGQQCCTGANLF